MFSPPFFFDEQGHGGYLWLALPYAYVLTMFGKITCYRLNYLGFISVLLDIIVFDKD